MTLPPSALLFILFFLLALAFGLFSARRTPKKSNPGDLPIHTGTKSILQNVKTAMQMLIGFSLFCLLVMKGFTLISPQMGYTRLSGMISQVDTLELAAIALALSAAMELAYLLFTSGTGEVVDPLIMGITATLLHQLSSHKFDHLLAGATAILLLYLCRLLFTQKADDGGLAWRLIHEKWAKKSPESD